MIEPTFIQIWQEIQGRTILSQKKARALWGLVKQTMARETGGALAEVGTFKGGSAYLMGAAAPGSYVHVFDTFKGLPPPHPKLDTHKEGQFQCDEKTVRQFLFKATTKYGTTYEVHPGVFPRTTKGLEKERFSVVHIDVDLYQGAKDCLEFFVPRMAKGGTLILDDYYGRGCPGARKATDDFLAKSTKLAMVPGPDSQAFLFVC
jgi:predicted O-methyltransferase YrrM